MLSKHVIFALLCDSYHTKMNRMNNKTNRIFGINILLLSLSSILLLSGCAEKKIQPVYDFEEIQQKKELTILTVSSSTSYFIYKDEAMGYDYELAESFCNQYGLKLNVKVAENSTKLLEMLEKGEGDIIAFSMPVLNEMKDSVLYCGPEQISHQVLVQRSTKRDSMITDVTQLIGKEVYVKFNTKYHQRLLNQDEELGTGIKIMDIARDTITEEDLIAMVATGEIKYTISDEYIAKLNKTYYRNLDISLPFSFEQRSSWVVRKDTPKLAEALNDWFAQNSKKPVYRDLMKRYFEIGKMVDVEYIAPINLPKGDISPFDHLFEKYAPISGQDWYLLASIGYQESRFKTNLSSWAGAIGLMGLMPRTAKAFGAEKDQLTDPEVSVKVSAALIARLDGMFKKISDPNERLKFVLAAYNGGNGHVADAQALARKYGSDPYKWDGHVEKYIELKSIPEYYNDPVCKNGYLRGSEVVQYVKQVTANQAKFKAMAEKNHKHKSASK